MSATETPPPRGPGYRPPPNAHDDGFDDRARSIDIAQRLGNTVKAMFSVHLELIEQEARIEARRIAIVGGLFGGGALFGAVSMVTLDFILILAIQRLTGLPWLESVAIGFGIFVVVALTLLIFAALMLRRPFMPRSRALVQRTVSSLSGKPAEPAPAVQEAL